MTDKHYKITARQMMNNKELEALRGLEESCNRNEELKLRLSWGMLTVRLPGETNDFLCYDESGELIGYLGVYGFGGSEIEISGMVHPENRRRGVFSGLLKAALKVFTEKGVTDVLLINERASGSGAAFVKSFDTVVDHSEYRMELEEIRPAGENKARVMVDTVAPGDIPKLAHIDAICFNMPEEETIKFYEPSRLSKNDQLFKAELEGKIIGMFKLHNEGRDILIFGFGLLPEYRGKGIGREILNIAVSRALERKPDKVALEVDCSNEIALSLYSSSGFRIVTTYDYFRLQKQIGETGICGVGKS